MLKDHDCQIRKFAGYVNAFKILRKPHVHTFCHQHYFAAEVEYLRSPILSKINHEICHNCSDSRQLCNRILMQAMKSLKVMAMRNHKAHLVLLLINIFDLVKLNNVKFQEFDALLSCCDLKRRKNHESCNEIESQGLLYSEY